MRRSLPLKAGKLQLRTRSSTALSKSSCPELCSSSTCSARVPAAATQTRTTTRPCSPRARASRGYSGASLWARTHLAYSRGLTRRGPPPSLAMSRSGSETLALVGVVPGESPSLPDFAAFGGETPGSAGLTATAGENPAPSFACNSPTSTVPIGCVAGPCQAIASASAPAKAMCNTSESANARPIPLTTAAPQACSPANSCALRRETPGTQTPRHRRGSSL